MTSINWILGTSSLCRQATIRTCQVGVRAVSQSPRAIADNEGRRRRLRRGATRHFFPYGPILREWPTRGSWASQAAASGPQASFAATKVVTQRDEPQGLSSATACGSNWYSEPANPPFSGVKSYKLAPTSVASAYPMGRPLDLLQLLLHDTPRLPTALPVAFPAPFATPLFASYVVRPCSSVPSRPCTSLHEFHSMFRLIRLWSRGRSRVTGVLLISPTGLDERGVAVLFGKALVGSLLGCMMAWISNRDASSIQ